MRIAVLFFVLALAGPASAAQTCPSDAKAPDACAEIARLHAKVAALEGAADLAERKLAEARGASAQLDIKYLADWYDHNRVLMRQVEKAFDWHHRATGHLHVLVIILVVTATLVSVAEIAYGLLYRPTQTGGGASQELEISANRIKLVTTVSGFMLLLITFAFFYVYVQQVYDLRPAALPTTEQPTPKK